MVNNSDKLVNLHKNTSNQTYLMYDKLNNEFITFNNNKIYLEQINDFFKKNNIENEYIITKVILNSLLINLEKEKEKEIVKVNTPVKILAEKERVELFELNRKINLLKQQQKRSCSCFRKI